eukprot:COSAG01_NODE_32624_length_578_cov_0.918580_2_plen_52_part_01
MNLCQVGSEWSLLVDGMASPRRNIGVVFQYATAIRSPGCHGKLSENSHPHIS